jgi:hypothetical protein
MAVILREQVAGQIATDHVVSTNPAVMSNGLAIFNVVGDVQILSLVSECYTSNNATASTLQYSFTSSNTTTATFSGATSTLASLTAGYAVILAAATALTTAPTISSNNAGVLLNTNPRGVRLPTGTIKLVIGVGSTTGTWKHYIRWEPLEQNAYITAAF